MAVTAPVRHKPSDAEIPEIHALLHRAFASMDGRIDPPSSLHRLTPDDIAAHCLTGEVWSIGLPPDGCMFLSLKSDCLYLGKLAVDPSMQGNGIGRKLISLAEERCRAHGRLFLELQTRVELVENHLAFGRMGFVVTGRTAHPGFDRPTSMTFRKMVARGAD
ncbi:GNAT family N-acetyltransferase [Sulfitobacter sp. LCG007]